MACLNLQAMLELAATAVPCIVIGKSSAMCGPVCYTRLCFLPIGMHGNVSWQGGVRFSSLPAYIPWGQHCSICV
jgi:hypothetical protein